jgi:hypothetical protein
MAEAKTRASIIRAFETAAEMLVVSQLDLLAQIEAQLRAVHHTMRRIERLRGAKLRIGSQVSDRQRETALKVLSDEVAHLEKQFVEERECCWHMQDTIRQMQEHLAGLQHTAARLENEPAAAPQDEDGSLGTG